MTTDGRRKRAGWLHGVAVAVPVVACLFCPVCLPAGIGVLSALGVGIFVNEGVHRVLVATSIAVALASALFLTRRHRKIGPLAVTAAGGVAVVAGCIVAEVPALEYAGTALILAAAFWSWRLRGRPVAALVKIQTRPRSRLLGTE